MGNLSSSLGKLAPRLFEEKSVSMVYFHTTQNTSRVGSIWLLSDDWSATTTQMVWFTLVARENTEKSQIDKNCVTPIRREDHPQSVWGVCNTLSYTYVRYVNEEFSHKTHTACSMWEQTTPQFSENKHEYMEIIVWDVSTIWWDCVDERRFDFSEYIHLGVSFIRFHSDVYVPII